MVPRWYWNPRASTQYWNHYQRNISSCHRASVSHDGRFCIHYSRTRGRQPGHDSITVMKEISVHPESGIDIDGGRRRRIGWAQETELSYRVFIIPRLHKGDEYPVTRTPPPPCWLSLSMGGSSCLCGALLAFSFSFESYFYVRCFLLCELTLYQVTGFFSSSFYYYYD